MIMNDHSPTFTNVHEWLRMIMNVQERSWTFKKVREGSNEGSRIRTSGSYEWPELYNENLISEHLKFMFGAILKNRQF